MNKNSRPVYSTSNGRLCLDCGKSAAACICKQLARSASNDTSGTVYISRESKGRGGKEVSVIKSLPLNLIELKLLAAELKSRCGSGGTVTNGTIEIQGDHRNKLKNLLESKGHKVKLAGG